MSNDANIDGSIDTMSDGPDWKVVYIDIDNDQSAEVTVQGADDILEALDAAYEALGEDERYEIIAIEMIPSP